MTTVHNTFVIERNYLVTPQRLFAALSDPAQKRHWYAEGKSHDTEHFEMDFRVGGREYAAYRFRASTPFPGVALTSDGTYLDIVPDRRIVIAGTMSIDGKCMSAALATFEVTPAEKGTDLLFTHQAAFFENADGPEMREAGWRKLLGQLADEVSH